MQGRRHRHLILLVGVLSVSSKATASETRCGAVVDARGVPDREVEALRQHLQGTLAHQSVNLEFLASPVDCSAARTTSAGEEFTWFLTVDYWRVGSLAKGTVRLVAGLDCRQQVNREWSVDSKEAYAKDLDRALEEVAARIAAATPPPPPPETVAEPTLAPIALVEPTTTGPRLAWLPWTLAGAGVVGLGVGAGFYASALKSWACAKDEACAGRQRAVGATQRSERVAWTLGGVGLAALAAGLTLWILRDQPAASGVGVTLLATPSSASLVAVVRWPRP